MTINFTTKYFKVNTPKEKEYAFVKALDTVGVEAYNFIIDLETAEKLNEHKGEFLTFTGYSTYKDKQYKTNLSTIATLEGDTLYEYKKK